MTHFKASEARRRFYSLMHEVAHSHKAVVISGKRNNVVLISESDWRAIQESLHLAAVSGMRKAIWRGLRTPVKKCSEDPGW
jgi:prevent-host-death family protein